MLTVIEAGSLLMEPYGSIVECVSKGYSDLVRCTAGGRWEQFCPYEELEEEKTQRLEIFSNYSQYYGNCKGSVLQI